MAVQYAGEVPKSPRLAIFDPYGDYEYRTDDPKNRGFGGKRVFHYETRKSFMYAFIAAWSSKKPFRVAFKPHKPSRADMLWFCDLMWAAADGNRRLDVVIEELAKWVESAGKEQSILGECLTGGRKFGLVMHTVFQRSTEVPKTIISQSPFKYVGKQPSRADAKRMAAECEIDIADILDLSDLLFYKKGEQITDVWFVDLRHLFDSRVKKTKPVLLSDIKAAAEKQKVLKSKIA